MGIGAKRSKKSKSKRQTLKQKYKVLRKWPFKEELVAQLKAQKERALLKERALRDQRRAAAAAAMEHDGGDDGGDAAGMAAMRTAAARRGREHERAAAGGGGDAGHGGFVDYSRRSFYKEFVKVVEASEVIIEVLDARDPAGCHCADVERFVRRLDPSKKIVLLLNKIALLSPRPPRASDLVPREVVEAWLKYFREELPCVAFKCSTQKQAANLGRRQLSAATDAGLKGSECLGADALLHLLKNYARSADLKTAITVGVVGLPNVGKSSLINSLKRTRVAQVGNTPGVTRAVQEVHLDKHVTLLDCPGVVFADAGADGAAAAALRNCVKVEQLEDPALPVAEVVRRCPPRQLMALYKVPAFDSPERFLAHVAQARGKLKKGGTVDVAAAARIVLQARDWNDGRIPYYTLPPKRESEVAGSAAVVPAWGADFSADARFAEEQARGKKAHPRADGCGREERARGRDWGRVRAPLARRDVRGGGTRREGPARRCGPTDHIRPPRCALPGRPPTARLPSPPEQSAVVAGLPSLEDPAAAFFQTRSVGAARVDVAGLEAAAAAPSDASEGSEGMEEEEEEGEEEGAGGSDDEAMSDGEAGGAPSSSGAAAMDEAEAAAAAAAPGATARRQNAALYSAAGQLNPRAARAERRRAKKAGAAARRGGGGGGRGGNDSGSDYDFGADWEEGEDGANPYAQIADAGDA
eukprot:scaffold2.g7173.t1